jgi:hypothetical protein
MCHGTMQHTQHAVPCACHILLAYHMVGQQDSRAAVLPAMLSWPTIEPCSTSALESRHPVSTGAHRPGAEDSDQEARPGGRGTGIDDH